MIGAAREAGALGAALSGAGGSVIAIADRHTDAVGLAMKRVAEDFHIAARILELRSPAKPPALSVLHSVQPTAR
jgi:homoserine kinase